MKKRRTISNWRSILLLLSVVLLISFCVNLGLGSVAIPFEKIVSFLTGQLPERDGSFLILSKFRLPKALTALLVGGSLGVAGLQMQTLFRNPLAGPYILGISSGAGLGVAITIFLGFHIGGLVEMSGIGRSWLLVLSAGAGSLLVLLIIVAASTRIQDSVSLLIIGLMFGAASGALVSILQFFSQADNIQAYVLWSFGSLGSLSWVELSVFIPLLVISLMGSVLLSKPLNALLVGENYAISVGLNIKLTRLLIILNTALLAGTVTAFCGPIAFFGIAMPHLTRMLFNTSNHLLLTPLIVLLGGIMMLLFDTIAQLPGAEAVLPINAVTALFGAPFVIYLLVQKKSVNFS